MLRLPNGPGSRPGPLAVIDADAGQVGNVGQVVIAQVSGVGPVRHDEPGGVVDQLAGDFRCRPFGGFGQLTVEFVQTGVRKLCRLGRIVVQRDALQFADGQMAGDVLGGQVDIGVRLHGGVPCDLRQVVKARMVAGCRWRINRGTAPTPVFRRWVPLLAGVCSRNRASRQRRNSRWWI